MVRDVWENGIWGMVVMKVSGMNGTRVCSEEGPAKRESKVEPDPGRIHPEGS